MTGYLSRRAARIEPRFPAVCPKCGAEFIRGQRYRAQHFRSAHADAIGRATWIDDATFSREFVYLSPTMGSSGLWNVVWLDWPVEVVRMRHERYVVQWIAGTVPAEGGMK